MSITAEVTPKTLSEAWTTPVHQIATLALHARFNAIGLILEDIERRAPASEDDPAYLLDEKKFKKEIDVLRKFSDTIQYSGVYVSFAHDTRRKTLAYLRNDTSIINGLIGWADLPVEKRRNIMRRVQDHHVTAARSVSGLDFEPVDIGFFSQPKKHYPEANTTRVLCGYLNAVAGSNRLKHSIQINEHPDAHIDDPVRAMGVTFHESTHDHQYQLGQMLRRRREHYLRSFARDGKLWNLKSDAKATIPGRIPVAYREQFHEAITFDQESIFMSDLRLILGRHAPDAQPERIAASLG